MSDRTPNVPSAPPDFDWRREAVLQDRPGPLRCGQEALLSQVLGMLGHMDAQPLTPWFASASRELARAAARLGMVAPSFRSPPAVPGVDRTLRRQIDGGGAIVAIRLWGRPFAAIRADMIAGVLAANDVVPGSADAAQLAPLLEEVVPVPEERRAA